MINHNVGLLERTIRVILGAFAILIASTMGASLPGIAIAALYIIGLVLVITGFIGYCPIFAALGINTCEECKVEEKSSVVAKTTMVTKAVKPRATAKKATAKKATKKTAKKTTSKKTKKTTRSSKKTTRKTTKRKKR